MAQFNNNQRGIPANQQQQQQPQQQQRSGRRWRDFQRMNNYNENRTGSWADEVEVNERFEQARNQYRPRSQQQQAKPQAPKGRRDNRGPPPPKPTADSPPKDEVMYQGSISASVPLTITASHNIEYSGFINVIEEFWKMSVKEDNRFERQVPFALFQHVMFGALQVRIAQYQRFDNGDSLYSGLIDTKMSFGEEFRIPKVILDYIDSVATAITPSGDRVAINQPRISVPLGPLPEQGTKAAITSGSFGELTAASHNVYECYASPYISRRLIEQTIRANETRDFGDWNPFPNGWIPEPSLVTRNLIGYNRPMQVHPDALSMLRRLEFLNDDTLLGRIAYSSYATNQVSQCLQKISSIEMVPMEFKGKDTPSVFGFKVYDGLTIDADRSLSSMSANIKSPYALGAPMAFKCLYQGFKAERTATNPGYCIVKSNLQPYPGWSDTINDNFKMAGLFAPRNMMSDKSSLREAAHLATAPIGKLEIDVSAHIYRTLKKK